LEADEELLLSKLSIRQHHLFPDQYRGAFRRFAHPEEHEEAGVKMAYLSSDNRRFEIAFKKPTRAEFDQVEDLISSLDRIYWPSISLMRIIYALTKDFYTEKMNASETAEAIQRLALGYLERRTLLNS